MRLPTLHFRPVLLAVVLLLLAGCGTPRPEGISDDAADALATRMMTAVDAQAWKRTGALTWTYDGRSNHLWDRRRQFARVRRGDREVFVNLRTKMGVAIEAGERLGGAERDAAVRKAYEAWINDSFWLTAMNKAFDPGTTRFRVKKKDGTEALLVQYSSGGVTPGDAYLWHFDESGRPNAWQMWVSKVPVDGIEATWDGWVKLRTGALVSTLHEIGLITIEITELDGAETLGQLVEGPDPFAPLLDPGI